jgi:hypothetical protein
MAALRKRLGDNTFPQTWELERVRRRSRGKAQTVWETEEIVTLLHQTSHSLRARSALTVCCFSHTNEAI